MCLLTENPRKCFCASKMSADGGTSDSRTFDENRCDSTALLERELKLTAEKCSVMAEKLTKSGSVQRHRKHCEQQTETENLISDLEHEILTLKTENARLQKLLKIKQHKNELNDQQDEISGTHNILKECEHKISALRAENLKLRQLLKDVTEVNKRWQKYNRETQAYIQRLEESIRNQNHKEFDLSLLPLPDETSSVDRQNARLFLGSRYSDSQLEQNMGQSALRLRYENAVKEVCKLKKHIEESQHIQEAFMQQMELLRKEKTDQLMLLELQIKAYKEDWEAEKKEKIIAQEKLAQLTEEMRELKTELKDCKQRLKHIQATSSSSTPSEGLWNKIKPAMSYHSKLTGIKSWANALTERNPYHGNNIGVLVADGADEIQKSHSAPTSWESVKVEDIQSSSLTDDMNALECPGCKRSFPRSLHLQFLDHFEECQAPHVES